jgi:hypothetical protein
MGRLNDFAVGLCVGGVIMTAVETYVRQDEIPHHMMAAPDLNNDGITDVVITGLSGHKTPMYGVETEDCVIYLSAAKMKEMQPDSIVDYEVIEDRLNEQRE